MNAGTTWSSGAISRRSVIDDDE